MGLIVWRQWCDLYVCAADTWAVMHAVFCSSLGVITAHWSGAAITRIDWADHGTPKDTTPDFPSTVYTELQACFDGREEGADIPVSATGTPFQETVWAAIRRIPRGHLMTYSALAEAIGNSRSTRAVANACGANPCAVLIPCHRVIRRNQGIGGYAWGLSRKRQLLAREGWVVTDQGIVLSRGI